MDTKSGAVRKINTGMVILFIGMINVLGIINISWQRLAENVDTMSLFVYIATIVIGWGLALWIIRKGNTPGIIANPGIKMAWSLYFVSICILIIRWLMPGIPKYRIGPRWFSISTAMLTTLLYIFAILIFLNKSKLEHTWIYILVCEAVFCILLHIFTNLHVYVAACILITAVAILRKQPNDRKNLYVGYGSLCAAVLYCSYIMLRNRDSLFANQDYNAYLWMNAIKQGSVEIDGSLLGVSIYDDAVSLIMSQNRILGLLAVILFVIVIILLLVRVCSRWDSKQFALGGICCIYIVFLIICNLLRNITGFSEPIGMPFFSAGQLDNIIYLMMLGFIIKDGDVVTGQTS